MKCSRCKRILVDSNKGLHACTKCGLPYYVGEKAEEVVGKKNRELVREVEEPKKNLKKRKSVTWDGSGGDGAE